jgi:hypothetical protein
MKRLRPLSFALLASTAALVWSLPALAVYPGSCTNGKTIYNKTNAATGVTTSCSNGSCHKSDPSLNTNKIQNGSGSPSGINNALDGTTANAAMTALDLRNNLPLSAQDIDDLATYLFYIVCPTSAPTLKSAPTSVTFGSTTVVETSAPVAVAITNSGTASATAIGFSNSNAGEFLVSGNSCTGATVAVGATCGFSVAFAPTSTGARSGTLILSYNSKTLVIGLNGTGTTATTSSPTVPVVEFYNPIFDHYFITSVPVEISLLNARQPPFQDWVPTGLSFNGYANATAPASSVAICRFFNSTFAPKSSHFYAPHGLGCEATIAGFPDWKLEDDKLFNSMLPDASGACPAGTIPVYRLYNNGMGGAPNHRFVTSLAERQNMINKGFVAEGNGIGVGMCAPQ